jgi:LPPG:FO 2-phospho-L-lactate transferase
MNITVLAGGWGGALSRRRRAGPPRRDVTVISNTGDDEDFFGLRVSPTSTSSSTRSQAVDAEGWGLTGDVSRTPAPAGYGHGSARRRRLATLAHRTMMLHDGATLSEATASIMAAYGLKLTILPVSDDRIKTMVEPAGTLVQEYFVKRRTEDDAPSLRRHRRAPRPACSKRSKRRRRVHRAE